MHRKCIAQRSVSDKLRWYIARNQAPNNPIVQKNSTPDDEKDPIREKLTTSTGKVSTLLLPMNRSRS